MCGGWGGGGGGMRPAAALRPSPPPRPHLYLRLPCLPAGAHCIQRPGLHPKVPAGRGRRVRVRAWHRRPAPQGSAARCPRCRLPACASGPGAAGWHSGGWQGSAVQAACLCVRAWRCRVAQQGSAAQAACVCSVAAALLTCAATARSCARPVAPLQHGGADQGLSDKWVHGDDQVLHDVQVHRGAWQRGEGVPGS